MFVITGAGIEILQPIVVVTKGVCREFLKTHNYGGCDHRVMYRVLTNYTDFSHRVEFKLLTSYNGHSHSSVYRFLTSYSDCSCKGTYRVLTSYSDCSYKGVYRFLETIVIAVTRVCADFFQSTACAKFFQTTVGALSLVESQVTLYS